MGVIVWPLSFAAQDALGRSHSMDIRVTAYTATSGVISDLPVAGGSITVDATSQTRRHGTIELADAAFWPADPAAVLSPLGSELFVEYGIILANGTTEWVPLIYGIITEAARTRPTSGNQNAFTVTVADRSTKVTENRFDQPTQTILSATTVAEIKRLITQVLPAVTVTDATGSTQVAAQLEIERERWSDGIEKLADSIAAEVFATPTGDFLIRPQPVLTGTPVWTVSTGDRGVVVTVNEKKTRDLTYNRVVASGQRTDGTPPVFATVSDTDPASPTYVGGPFGIKTRFYSSNTLTTTTQATTAAQGLLARTTGMQGSVTLTLVTNPSLDAGDVILVRDVDAGTIAAHIIDTLTIPLSPDEAQQLTTRSLQLPPES